MMNYDTFINELSVFVENNELKNKDDFLNLALYTFIQESGLDDNMVVKLVLSDLGELTVTQLKNSFFESSYHLRDHQATDSKSLTPLYYSGDFVLSKSTIGYNNSRYTEVMDNKRKESMLHFYNDLLTCKNLNELYDAIADGEDINKFKDKKINDISSLLWYYGEYTYALKHGHAHGEKMGQALDRLLLMSNQYNKGNDRAVHHACLHLADIINKPDTPFDLTVFFKGANIDKVAGVNTVIDLQPEHLDLLAIEGTVISTIINAIKNKTTDTLIDDIYTYHIKPHLDEHYEMATRLLKRQKTLEDKLGEPLLHQFIDSLRVKYPNSFKENELQSFKSTVYEPESFDTSPLKLSDKTLFDVLNKFDLNDKSDMNGLISNYTDSYNFSNKTYYKIGNYKNEIMLLGETDVSVKYLIQGELEAAGSNEQFSAFRVSSCMLLKKDSIYNEMALNHLFKYCQDKKYVLIFDHGDLKAELDSCYPVFEKVAESYKDKVYYIEGKDDEMRRNILEQTTLDYSTLIEYKERIFSLSKENSDDGESFMKRSEAAIKSISSKNKI